MSIHRIKVLQPFLTLTALCLLSACDSDLEIETLDNLRPLQKLTVTDLKRTDSLKIQWEPPLTLLGHGVCLDMHGYGILCFNDDKKRFVSTSHVHTNLVYDQVQSYSAWVVDKDGKYKSEPLYAEGTPSGTLPNIDNFAAHSEINGSVRLEWTVESPYESIRRVLILRSENGFPTNPQDSTATVIYDNSPGRQHHEDLLDLKSATTYYYTAWSCGGGGLCIAPQEAMVRTTGRSASNVRVEMEKAFRDHTGRVKISWDNVVSSTFSHLAVARDMRYHPQSHEFVVGCESLAPDTTTCFDNDPFSVYSVTGFYSDGTWEPSNYAFASQPIMHLREFVRTKPMPSAITLSLDLSDFPGFTECLVLRRPGHPALGPADASATMLHFTVQELHAKYTDRNLDPTQTYYYTVYPKEANGLGFPTIVGVKPVDLFATIEAEENSFGQKTGTVSIQWQLPNDAYYNTAKIYKSLVAPPETAAFGEEFCTTSPCRDETLSHGDHVYYSLFAGNENYFNYPPVALEIDVVDQEPPQPVSHLQIMRNSLNNDHQTFTLSWLPPDSLDLSKIVVRASSTEYPTTIDGGVEVACQTLHGTTEVIPMYTGARYYSVFALDEANNSSPPVQISTPGLGHTTFTSSTYTLWGKEQALLSWDASSALASDCTITEDLAADYQLDATPVIHHIDTAGFMYVQPEQTTRYIFGCSSGSEPTARDLSVEVYAAALGGVYRPSQKIQDIAALGNETGLLMERHLLVLHPDTSLKSSLDLSPSSSHTFGHIAVADYRDWFATGAQPSDQREIPVIKKRHNQGEYVTLFDGIFSHSVNGTLAVNAITAGQASHSGRLHMGGTFSRTITYQRLNGSYTNAGADNRGQEIFFLTADSTGDAFSIGEIGGSGDDYLTAIASTPTGKLLLAGQISEQGANEGLDFPSQAAPFAFIAQHNAINDFQWSLADREASTVDALVSTINANYAALRTDQGSAIKLAKLTDTGETTWSRRITAVDATLAPAIVVSDGAIEKYTHLWLVGLGSGRMDFGGGHTLTAAADGYTLWVAVFSSEGETLLAAPLSTAGMTSAHLASWGTDQLPTMLVAGNYEVPEGQFTIAPGSAQQQSITEPAGTTGAFFIQLSPELDLPMDVDYLQATVSGNGPFTVDLTWQGIANTNVRVIRSTAPPKHANDPDATVVYQGTQNSATDTLEHNLAGKVVYYRAYRLDELPRYHPSTLVEVVP